MSRQDLVHGKPFLPYRLFISALVPRSLCSRDDLSPGSKLLYGRLALYSGANGRCNPKLETLAADMGVPRTTVKRWLAELVENDLIIRVRGGQGQSASCVFLWHESLSESLLDGPDLVPQNVLDGPEMVSQSTLMDQKRTFDGPDLVHTLRNRKGSLKETTTKATQAPPLTQPRGTRFSLELLPADWIDFASTDLGWDTERIESTFENFSDYWRAKAGKDATKVDWLATWRRWCRTERDRYTASRKPTAPHTRQQELEYARATAAADEKALSDKIANLEALKNYQTLNALYAEADKTDLEIHQAKAELLKQQVDDQTKLNDLASEWRRQMTNEALDMVSGNLAKDVTGQHKQAHWGQDMKNIGGNMVQSAIKSALQMGLKKIGTKQNPAYVIVVGGTPMANPLASLPGVGQLPPALGGALKAGGGFLGGLLGKLFGSGVGSSSSSIQFMADGGDTYPGRSYVVGDGGEPEMFTPGVRGTITPFSKMGRGNVTYNISAPNGQLGVENRIARAMEYTHNSAVSSLLSQWFVN